MTYEERQQELLRRQEARQREWAAKRAAATVADDRYDVYSSTADRPVLVMQVRHVRLGE